MEWRWGIVFFSWLHFIARSKFALHDNFFYTVSIGAPDPFIQSAQKMALKAFYFKDLHRICEHIARKSASSAIFWLLSKANDMESLFLWLESIISVEILVFLSEKYPNCWF